MYEPLPPISLIESSESPFYPPKPIFHCLSLDPPLAKFIFPGFAFFDSIAPTAVRVPFSHNKPPLSILREEDSPPPPPPIYPLIPFLLL